MSKGGGDSMEHSQADTQRDTSIPLDPKKVAKPVFVNISTLAIYFSPQTAH